MGTDIEVILDWKINGSIISTYVFRTSDMFPFVVHSLSTLEGIEMTILTAVYTDAFKLNITSVLKGNVASLQGSIVYCITPYISFSSEKYYVEVQGKLFYY